MGVEKDFELIEVSQGQSFTSGLLTVSAFFLGFLLVALDNISDVGRAPVLLLIVAFFSNLLAFVIYTNVGGYGSRLKNAKKSKQIIKQIEAGNLLSEFIGLYPLLIAAPLAISASFDDNFLRISVAVVTTIGILIYTVSNYSILARYIGSMLRAYFAVAITIATVAMILLQQDNNDAVLVIVVSLLAALGVTTAVLYLKGEHN